MIINNLEILKNEFKRIKKMGYVKSTREGYTGIEKTFEDLLGKKEDSLSNPDFHGIEIKTKRAFSKSYTTLFNATPRGKTNSETKRLKNIYGYPDQVIKKAKVLNQSVQANCSTFVAGRYLFKLNIDKEQERVYLCITDKNFWPLEREVYWTFEELEQKLYKKLKYLAFVKAWTKNIDGEDYYKYYDINFYKLKGFEEFLRLLEDGTIRVSFKIGVFRSGKRMGEARDRGTSFEIEELDLYKLFDEVEV